jgi:signal transduction histidine kinase
MEQNLQIETFAQGVSSLNQALQIDDNDALALLERRKQRERALEEIRAFMAHEFRHALVPLNAYVKLLEEEIAQPTINKEKVNALTEKIQKQTVVTFALLDKYLDYSRALLPQFVNTDISVLLNESLEELRGGFENQNIVLKTHFEQNVNAEIDKQMLEQVIRNVLTNAMQAIDKDGCLDIATSVDNNNAVITIIDSGTGIKPEHLERIFDIGFTTKSNARGAGIGLALSKRIIEEAHRGSIAIANNTDGKGATVTISLPTKQTELLNGKNLTLTDS